MLDTGAVCDVMSHAACLAIKGVAGLISSPTQLLIANGSSFGVKGMTTAINMEIRSQTLPVNFAVADGLEKEDFLLARTFG